MTTHSDIAARWVAVVEGHATRLIGSSQSMFATYGRTRRVAATDPVLYSYGAHFPLAVPIRGETGTLELYLLNGDRYSVSTTRHQSITRDAVAGGSVPALIVPFSAIDAANIDTASIRFVEIRPDRLVPVKYRCRSPHRVYNDDDGRDFYGMGRGDEVWDCDTPGTEHVARQHVLGDAVFTANVIGHDQYQKITRENVRFVSSFDYQEPRALYFLAELPAYSHADTVEAALIDLRPELVLKADADGRTVTRQGDMFAVEPVFPFTRRILRGQGAVFARRSESTHGVSLFGTAHTATEVAILENGQVWARGQFRHEPRSMGEWRDADHVRRPILDGKAWARIIPNTVPRGTRGTLGDRVIAAPRAWTIAGRVD